MDLSRRKIDDSDLDGDELDAGAAGRQLVVRARRLHSSEGERLRGAIGWRKGVVQASRRSKNLEKGKRQAAQEHNGNCSMAPGEKSYAIHYSSLLPIPPPEELTRL
jgi:hypothetical protein